MVCSYPGERRLKRLPKRIRRRARFRLRGFNRQPQRLRRLSPTEMQQPVSNRPLEAFLSCCRVLSQEMYPSDERNSFVYLGTGRKRFFIVVLPETDKTVLKLDRRNRLESTQWGAVSTLSNR